MSDSPFSLRWAESDKLSQSEWTKRLNLNSSNETLAHTEVSGILQSVIKIVNEVFSNVKLSFCTEPHPEHHTCVTLPCWRSAGSQTNISLLSVAHWNLNGSSCSVRLQIRLTDLWHQQHKPVKVSDCFTCDITWGITCQTTLIHWYTPSAWKLSVNK